MKSASSYIEPIADNIDWNAFWLWRNTTRYKVMSPRVIRPAAPRQPLVLAKEFLEQAPVAIQDQIADAVELDLLHVAVAGQNPFQIVEPAPLGSSPRVEAEGLGGEPGLGNERGDRGGDQHQDAPRREADQQDGVGRKRQRILRDGEDLKHQRQGPRGSFSPRVLHLVVDVGVLEVSKLERERFLENLDVDDVSQRGS